MPRKQASLAIFQHMHISFDQKAVRSTAMTSAQPQLSEMTQGSVSLSSMACRNVFLELGELCKEDFISFRRGMGVEGRTEALRIQC